MAFESRPRFPLRFGVESGPVAAEGSHADATEYRIEVDRDYGLMVQRRDTLHRLGNCRVEGTQGRFTVIPSAELISGLTAPAFYAMWATDGEGIATLQDVLLIENRHGPGASG
ncbi:MAG TPA: hypothetical protein VLR46_00515 [Candidatus Dormibacteraeota bacterium]|nr:hypothetical protein [Candidatus Dormibacteraeota bacterium]